MHIFGTFKMLLLAVEIVNRCDLNDKFVRMRWNAVLYSEITKTTKYPKDGQTKMNFYKLLASTKL